MRLVAELDSGPQNGSYLLRRALRAAGDGAHSEAEAAAAGKLARADVPPFELNVPIVDQHGVVLFAVDVLWRALRAALEIDSREFHFSQADWHDTLARHNKLTRYGLAVTHYSPSVVSGAGTGWLTEVAGWLRARAAELKVAMPRGSGAVTPPMDVPPAPFVVAIGR